MINMTRKWLGDIYGYVCNHCGKSVKEITVNSNWEETNTTSSIISNYSISHFCPTCSRARKLIEMSTEYGDYKYKTKDGSNIELNDVKIHNKALSKTEIESLFYFERNK